MAAKECGGQGQRARHGDESLFHEEHAADAQPAGDEAEIKPIIAPLPADGADVRRVIALDVVKKPLDALPCRLLAKLMLNGHVVGGHAVQSRDH